MRLTSLAKAHLYIPLLDIDCFMTRTKEGAWVLPDMSHLLNKRSSRTYHTLDNKDVYGKRSDSIETVLNDELMKLVNDRMMQDESAGDPMSES